MIEEGWNELWNGSLEENDEVELARQKERKVMKEDDTLLGETADHKDDGTTCSLQCS